MLVDQMTLLIALTSLNLLALGALALWIRSELDNAVEELDSTLALASSWMGGSVASSQ